MTHLLDTNACIHHLRNGPNSKVSQRLLASPADSICLCSVVVAELLYGARRSQQSAAALDKVR
ncbi:MAG: type II toxin-antitoxin system VapC family toxin, partial [Planctomycetota bacterium]